MTEETMPGKILWDVQDTESSVQIRMYCVRLRGKSMFLLVKRNEQDDEWTIAERCTLGRAKWWTNIFLSGWKGEETRYEPTRVK
jgi:hypothetical protein